MLQDKDEELKRLSDALLAEEEATDATIVRKPSGKAPKRVRNTDSVDVDMEKFSAAVERPERLTGLVILMIFLTAAVVCAVAWWVLRLKGMI